MTTNDPTTRRRRTRSPWGRLRRGLRRHRLPAAGAVAVLVVGVVVAVTVGWRTGVTPSVVADPSAARAGTSATSAGGASEGSIPVAVIGDSVSAGTRYGGLGAANWSQLVGAARGWSVTDTAIGGTGYVNPGEGASSGSFEAAQLDRALAADPRIVIVQGSRNDIGHPAAQLRAAATQLYRDIRSRVPDARLVVVGPYYDPGASRTRVPALDILRRAAEGAGATFIDPMAEMWFPTAAYPGPLIGPDRVHPTDAGHALIAKRVLADLDRAGV